MGKDFDFLITIYLVRPNSQVHVALAIPLVDLSTSSSSLQLVCPGNRDVRDIRPEHEASAEDGRMQERPQGYSTKWREK